MFETRKEEASVEEIRELKERLERERPVEWEAFPDIGLYMDQLISYMPRQLIHYGEGESLTSAMVNNYIKDGLVPRADGKRYGPIHLGYLTADANGRPLYYGTRSVPGSSYATGCDVLDETGNVVMQGLGSCYSYYDNSLNALPDHVFVARRGFYYGWMDTDGNWLYCQSIFSSVNADDELGY